MFAHDQYGANDVAESAAQHRARMCEWADRDVVADAAYSERLEDGVRLLARGGDSDDDVRGLA